MDCGASTRWCGRPSNTSPCLVRSRDAGLWLLGRGFRMGAEACCRLQGIEASSLSKPSRNIVNATEYALLKTVPPNMHPCRPPIRTVIAVSRSPYENHDPACKLLMRAITFGSTPHFSNKQPCRATNAISQSDCSSLRPRSSKYFLWSLTSSGHPNTRSRTTLSKAFTRSTKRTKNDSEDIAQ